MNFLESMRKGKMIECKISCPQGIDGCCYFCNEFDCKDKCSEPLKNCDNAIEVKDDEYNEELAVEAFKRNQATIIRKITTLVKAKKELEEAEAELKGKLQEAMEIRGIKKFISEELSVTYVAPTTSTTLDSAKLKKKYPEIAAECSKTSNKRAYVKIEVK